MSLVLLERLGISQVNGAANAWHSRLGYTGPYLINPSQGATAMFGTLGVVGFFVAIIALARAHSAISQLSELKGGN